MCEHRERGAHGNKTSIHRDCGAVRGAVVVVPTAVVEQERRQLSRAVSLF